MRQNHTHQTSALALAIASAFAPAHAQSLDEVVVSASRAEQRSFDAPAAIQRVGRDQIEGGGPQVNLNESLVRVPGLTVLDRGNYAQDLQVSIRGFGARSAFGIRGIRLLIDGIPATTPDGQGQGSSISLTSTDHIEVLRGPMAQLYGNSSGGVVQAFTKAASEQPEAGYQYYVGSHGLHRADYQFSDTVGRYGVVADYATFTVDGYRRNSSAERKQFNGTVHFDPNESTHVNLVFNQFDMPLAQDPLGLTAKQLAQDPTQAGTGATAYSTRKNLLQNQFGGSVTHAIDADRSWTGRAYAGERNNMQYQAATVPASGVFPQTASWVGLNRKFHGVGLQYNQRGTWSGLPVEWVAGYEFDRSQEYRRGGTTSAGQVSGGLSRSEDNRSENSDWFVQGTARATDRLSVTSGLRYSMVRFVSDDYYLGDGFDGSGNVSYSAVSPVLGITYAATEHLNLYANLGKGFETPTLAEMAYQDGATLAKPVSAVFNRNLKASGSRHYELGGKWMASPTARVDFAMYQIDTVDELVVSVSSAGQTAYTNAPGTSRSGMELSGSTWLTPHIAFNASASVIDAHYAQDFVNRTVTAGVLKSTTIGAGNKLPGIPQTSVFTELAWNSETTPARKGAPAMGTRLGVELIQAGRIHANDTNADSVDGHALLNFAASQRWAVGKGTLTLHGRINNATDQRYVGSVIVNQSGAQYFEPGLPRNWMVGLSLAAQL